MADSKDLASRVGFLATLLRLARADEVCTSERDHLGAVAEWMRATDQELGAAMQMADDETLELRDLVARVGSPDKGLLLFRECCAVAWADGRKSVLEQEFLDLLAQVLGVAEESRFILDSALACSPEGERRFLELIGGTSSSEIEG